VIFAPQWPKGEFVSLCWLHFVGQNHLYVILLFSQGCRIFQNLHSI
jgi:hypothetical protein